MTQEEINLQLFGLLGRMEAKTEIQAATISTMTKTLTLACERIVTLETRAADMFANLQTATQTLGMQTRIIEELHRRIDAPMGNVTLGSGKSSNPRRMPLSLIAREIANQNHEASESVI